MAAGLSAHSRHSDLRRTATWPAAESYIIEQDQRRQHTRKELRNSSKVQQLVSLKHAHACQLSFKSWKTIVKDMQDNVPLASKLEWFVVDKKACALQQAFNKWVCEVQAGMPRATTWPPASGCLTAAETKRW